MRIGRLTLAGFRSYEALEVEFGDGPQLIVGPNAAGKTNLLEALGVLGSGHSHRTSSDSELIGWGADFARLEVSLKQARDSGSGVNGDRPPEPLDGLEVLIARTGESARKRIRINGVPRRAAALAAALRVVTFAPEEMLLVTGSPSLRRSALDTFVVQRAPILGSVMATYGRGLQQRNGLLRAVREGLSHREELGYWNGVLIEEGGRIVAARLEALAALADPLAAAHAEMAPAEERLGIRYVTNSPAHDGEDPRDALRRRLADTAEKEIWNGATLVGPHRDDMAFEMAGRDLAEFASRGQQRTAILALKLAQLDLFTALDGRAPLLLLDDVFSELDPQRRAHLVRRIDDLPQSFVTTTTLDDLDPALVAASTSWQVSPGRLDALGRVTHP